jgi:hypothetical protein
MEGSKEGLGVLDYSCAQPSLESIFLKIAERDINRKTTRSPRGEGQGSVVGSPGVAPVRGPAI